MTDETPINVFISYAGPDRLTARSLRDELEIRGFHVTMDDSFDPGVSIMINIAGAMDTATVVLSIVTTEYLDRHFTEIELSTVLADAEGLLIPVLPSGEPRPATEHGRGLWKILRSRTHFALDDTPHRIDRLTEVIARIAGANSSSIPETASRRELLRQQMGALPQRLEFIYDWEDSTAVEAVLLFLNSNGSEIVIAACAGDLRAPVGSDSSIPLAVLWTNAARLGPETSERIVAAYARGQPLVYVRFPDSPQAPRGVRTIELDPSKEPHESSLRSTQPEASIDIGQQVADVLQLNGGVPFHLLGDKYAEGPNSVAIARAVYQSAAYTLPTGDRRRLQSALYYAAAERFTGNWQVAHNTLTGELAAIREADANPESLQVEAELLSIDFELGRVAGAIGKASGLLARSLSESDWPHTILLHRLLGMIHEEQGSYSSARDHFQRAYHYAEDLVDTIAMESQIASRTARVALWTDCERELAALEWRSGNPQTAQRLLIEASDRLSGESEHVAVYLSHVVQYQMAQVDSTLGAGYEEVKGKLEASYRGLQSFDNPVRLSIVLESMLRLHLDFLRGGDEQVLMLHHTLDKLLRVRTARNHEYMIVRTHEAKASLHSALGEWTQALEEFTIARNGFNKLGKVPEAAATARLISRCQVRLGDRDSALGSLEFALDLLSDSDQRGARSEIRSDMLRLINRRPKPTDVDPTIDLTGVGEFALHKWIAAELEERRPTNTNENVTVGVGDDGAVLNVDGATEDLVVSTDSVPTSLLDTADSDAARYTARFAVVSALSDIVAMGATPTSLLVNVHLQRSTPASWLHSLIQHIAIEASQYATAIVGGDLKERPYNSLTTTAIGSLPKSRAVTRSGARPGDYLAITVDADRQARLGARWAHELAPLLSDYERQFISGIEERDAKYHDMTLQTAAMNTVVESGVATAAIDTSDGILACAQLLGEHSNVGIELFPSSIDVLLDPEVHDLASVLGIEPFLFGLNAGHDWQVVITVPPSSVSPGEVPEVLIQGQPSSHVRVIGRAIQRTSESEDGVIVTQPSGDAALVPYFTDEKFVSVQYESRARQWLHFARMESRALRDNNVVLQTRSIK